MSTSVLVTYATRFGSTQEVAEAVASTLREHGLMVDVQHMPEVLSLEGYDAVVLGTALYMFRLHGDALHFLAKHRKALTWQRVAVFALGPFHDDPKEWETARNNLDKGLAKFPWLRPIDHQVFGGRFDPAKLTFPWNFVPGLRRIPATDIRDWAAIQHWASELAAKLEPTPPAGSEAASHTRVEIY
jgi:menaquinone-dependent protoporphyrinogen oxidase